MEIEIEWEKEMAAQIGKVEIIQKPLELNIWHFYR